MAPIKNKVQEELRKRICQFRNKHLDKPKVFTVKHFLEEGVPRSTIYCVLERVANNLGPIRKEGSGRVAKKMDKKHTNQLKAFIDHQHGKSQRQAARKFNFTQSHISQTLKDKTDIRYYEKKSIPFRTSGQLDRIKPLCRYLYRNFRNLD